MLHPGKITYSSKTPTSVSGNQLFTVTLKILDMPREEKDCKQTTDGPMHQLQSKKTAEHWDLPSSG